MHAQVRLPGVLVQVAFVAHPPLPVRHSLTSTHALPLSVKPALHAAGAQMPEKHAAVPLATTQVLPQPPQFVALPPRFTSQPSVALALQLAKPAVQVAREQVPRVQAPAPLA